MLLQAAVISRDLVQELGLRAPVLEALALAMEYQAQEGLALMAEAQKLGLELEWDHS